MAHGDRRIYRFALKGTRLFDALISSGIAQRNTREDYYDYDARTFRYAFELPVSNREHLEASVRRYLEAASA